MIWSAHPKSKSQNWHSTTMWRTRPKSKSQLALHCDVERLSQTKVTIGTPLRCGALVPNQSHNWHSTTMWGTRPNLGCKVGTPLQCGELTPNQSHILPLHNDVECFFLGTNIVGN